MKKLVYFLENNRNMSVILVFVSLLTLLLSFFFLFYYASPYASTWDQVDFALALNRFDLLAMQPHFPGYPYFILGGTFLHTFIENGAKALATLNILLLCFSSIPIYLLFRRYISETWCMLGVSILLSSSYLVIIVAQPMSEGSAIAILWWYLWSVENAKKSDKFSLQIIPLILFSILLGIRLSYFPFAIGILLLWWNQLKNQQYLKVCSLIISAILFQMIWIWGLIVAEGGLESFFKLAIAFTGGHFDSWGGAITSDNETLLSRLYHLVVYDFVWMGICAQSMVLLSIWCLVIIIALYVYLKYKYRLDYWLLIQGGLYFVWVLFGQNIDKPRHILPFIGIILFYLLIILLKKRNILIMITLFICLIVQQVINYQNLKEQVAKAPATYQMAKYIEKLEDNIVLYTWEETRVLQYLQVPFIHKRVFTYDYFLQDFLNYPTGTILITNHVVKGFEMQGIDIHDHIEKVAEFRTNKIYDPVYHQIIIYKYLE